MSSSTGTLKETLNDSENYSKPKPLNRNLYEGCISQSQTGEERPLGIPGIRDRIVEEALRMILAPIWESDFSVRSYGFRPNRSTYDAISYIGNNLPETEAATNGSSKAT